MKKSSIQSGGFLKDFLEWMGSPEGAESMDALDWVFNTLDGATVEPVKRKINWPDGESLSIEQSVDLIAKDSGLDRKLILSHIIGWIQMEYMPVKSQKEILKFGKNTPRNGYLFLDKVDWDTLCNQLCHLLKSIIEGHLGSNIDFNITYQAVDDDIDSFQKISVRMRRGQRLFRKNLLELYEGKCTISGWEPTEALEAVHILNHAESGINHTDNGIMLRADLHRLFDSNLIKINPDNLCVEVSQELEGSNLKIG